MERRLHDSPWQQVGAKKKTLIVRLVPVGGGRFNMRIFSRKKARDREGEVVLGPSQCVITSIQTQLEPGFPCSASLQVSDWLLLPADINLSDACNPVDHLHEMSGLPVAF